MSDPLTPAGTGGAVSFEINGHQYLTTLIPAEEGIGILARLISLLGEPLAGVAEAVLKDPSKLAAIVKAANTPGDSTKVEDVLSGVSLSSLGRDLRNGLTQVQAAPLIRDITRTTHRNTRPLRDDAEFNAAFRGNYFELLSLVWKLIQINRFFPLPGI
jgi:hypothetical protein